MAFLPRLRLPSFAVLNTRYLFYYFPNPLAIQFQVRCYGFLTKVLLLHPSASRRPHHEHVGFRWRVHHRWCRMAPR
jgi:hypothetical protein